MRQWRAAALAALRGAEMVVVLTSFKTAAHDVADVLLPIAPFTETSGTFVNAEGRVQSFHAAVRPLGDARPAWKVLRVLGTMLGLPGFEFETSRRCAPRRSAMSRRSRLVSRRRRSHGRCHADPASTIRGRTGAHGRRADLRHRLAGAPRDLAATHRRCPRANGAACRSELVVATPGIVDGKVPGSHHQGGASIVLPARVDRSLAANVIRVAAGHPLTAALGPMFGSLRIEVEPRR